MLMLAQVAVAVQGHLHGVPVLAGSVQGRECSLSRHAGGQVKAGESLERQPWVPGLCWPPGFLRKVVTATHKRHSADSRETGALQSNSLRAALPAPARGSTLPPRSCVRRV